MVAGQDAARLICEDLPRIVRSSLIYRNLKRDDLKRFVEVVEDQAYLRRQLAEAGLVAFVANGSVLPRQSGIEDTPLEEKAVPFEAPDSLPAEVFRNLAGQVARKLAVLAESTPQIADANITWVS